MKTRNRLLTFICKRLSNLKNIKFNWLFHQRQVMVASVAMICFYALLLCCCFLVFFSFNRISTRSYSIVAEELNDNDSTYKAMYNPDSLHLQINIPMSMNLEDSLQKGSIEIVPGYGALRAHYKDTTVYDKLNVLKMFNDEGIDSIAKKHEAFKDIRFEVGYLLNSEMFHKEKRNIYARELDSLKIIAQNIPIKKDTVKSLYYIKATAISEDFSVSKDLYIKNELSPDSIPLGNSFVYVDKLLNISLVNGKFDYENIIKIDKPTYTEANLAVSVNKGPLVAPSWFSMFDISQMYVDLSFRTISIEAPSIKIDFKTATSFSNIYPVPDIAEYSSIQYNNQEKIELIKKNGLKFHVSFPELQNKQSIRLFALTALMSFLFTFLIGNLFAIILTIMFKKKERE